MPFVPVHVYLCVHWHLYVCVCARRSDLHRALKTLLDMVYTFCLTAFLAPALCCGSCRVCVCVCVCLLDTLVKDAASRTDPCTRMLLPHGVCTRRVPDLDLDAFSQYPSCVD